MCRSDYNCLWAWVVTDNFMSGLCCLLVWFGRVHNLEEAT